ncbi:LPXTG cell wall anchor domain-containing protein, partial [uncultured Bifidobacterium sp.]|uniref:LPXTG cell wall anchor domain-containing protein n=1 Tax=uncultured Bifidobacterium sp. TaxID=165187 RepID=UPI002587497C
NVSFTQDAWHLVDPQTVTVKNVKSVTQLPLTGAAGITMLVVVALLLGGAGALIAIRSNSLKRQLNA